MTLPRPVGAWWCPKRWFTSHSSSGLDSNPGSGFSLNRAEQGQITFNSIKQHQTPRGVRQKMSKSPLKPAHGRQASTRTTSQHTDDKPAHGRQAGTNDHRGTNDSLRSATRNRTRTCTRNRTRTCTRNRNRTRTRTPVPAPARTGTGPSIDATRGARTATAARAETTPAAATAATTGRAEAGRRTTGRATAGLGAAMASPRRGPHPPASGPVAPRRHSALDRAHRRCGRRGQQWGSAGPADVPRAVTGDTRTAAASGAGASRPQRSRPFGDVFATGPTGQRRYRGDGRHPGGAPIPGSGAGAEAQARAVGRDRRRGSLISGRVCGWPAGPCDARPATRWGRLRLPRVRRSGQRCAPNPRCRSTGPSTPCHAAGTVRGPWR